MGSSMCTCTLCTYLSRKLITDRSCTKLSLYNFMLYFGLILLSKYCVLKSKIKLRHVLDFLFLTSHVIFAVVSVHEFRNSFKF